MQGAPFPPLVDLPVPAYYFELLGTAIFAITGVLVVARRGLDMFGALYEHSPWAASQAELDDLWRKRVKNDALSLMLTDKTWAETREVLRKRYERVAKRSEQVTADDVFENFMNAFAHVFDPHSSYFSPRNSEEYRIQRSLSYEGIGASLQSIDDYVTIMEILPGGSAQESGELKAQDRILEVDQSKNGKKNDIVD